MTGPSSLASSTSPRASIVITNYDYARFVGAAIESALSQRGGGVQVVVVDDGSTDDSLDVIARFEGLDGIEVVAKDNGGQGSAFNAGFARCRAPIVFFLDADDLLAPDTVDRVAAAFGDPDVVRVQFRLGLIDGEGRRGEGRMLPDRIELASGDVRTRLVRHPDDLAWQPTSGNAFRAAMLDEILPMPIDPYRIAADYYLSNLSAAHGVVAVLEGEGGSYRIHGANHDYTERVPIRHVRENVARTSVTHRLLRDECRRLGLDGLPDDPDQVRSVTATGMRMISLRFDPGNHPIPADRRFGLLRLGVLSAIGRNDLGWFRRTLMAAWFVAMAAAPRRLARHVARRLIPLADDASPGRPR